MKKKKGKIGSSFKQGSRSDRVLQDMKLVDLQKACIVRGMPFEDMVKSSVPQLHSWFDHNYQNSQDIKLLNEFDDWRELILKKKFTGPEDQWAFHPNLRFGFIGKKDSDGNTTQTKKPRLKGVDKVEKPKRERVEGTKVFMGTKKALTYQLTQEGKPLDEIIEAVMEQFPEAQEKSIKIWRNRALNEAKAKAGK